MINWELIPQITQGLIWRYVDEDAVLVNPQSGAVRVLNSVGTLVWKMIVKQASIGEIEKFLIAHYEVTEEKARDDLGQFLSELADHGLISRWA